VDRSRGGADWACLFGGCSAPTAQFDMHVLGIYQCSLVVWLVMYRVYGWNLWSMGPRCKLMYSAGAFDVMECWNVPMRKLDVWPIPE